MGNSDDVVEKVVTWGAALISAAIFIAYVVVPILKDAWRAIVNG